MQPISESVYVGMCLIAGTSQEIAFRREAEGIREMVERLVRINGDEVKMFSGSTREGLRLKGSDMDYMFWPTKHRVIMDVSQFEYYNTANTTLILSDSSESPPGYTLLQLLTPTKYRGVLSACVRMKNRVYISSSKYVKLKCSSSLFAPNVHGPCGSGNCGGVEIDHAHCFVSDFWPVSAYSWIDRCHSWPDTNVVRDIVRNGCHFVAIGHPLGSYENEEWRISFSLAEYKLVHSMNHVQLLTYGLLKLFLKEVINQQSEETNKLLCSYHIKTTVFWVIQQNTHPQWCPQTFLAGFWVCFKFLLKCVYEGICPHFFIPKNNLFLTKVQGSAQHNLFLQLHELYRKGLACLLQSSSIERFITFVIINPIISVCTDENKILSEIDYDLAVSVEPVVVEILPSGLTKVLRLIELLVDSSLTGHQVVILQKLTAFVLQCTAFKLHTSNTYTNTSVNKKAYITDKMSCHMLKLASKFGCVSDMLYIAMYYYKTFRYREALSIIEMTKVKLARPYLMYRAHVDRERYIKAVGGQSWSTKRRQAVASDIFLNSKICYISELSQERQSAIQRKVPILYIPVKVMLYFQEFLCYRKIDTTLSESALDELKALVHHDQGLYVHDNYRDISWEILGICQQSTGNLQEAIYSYQQSMKNRHNGISFATQIRIQNLIKSLGFKVFIEVLLIFAIIFFILFIFW